MRICALARKVLTAEDAESVEAEIKVSWLDAAYVICILPLHEERNKTLRIVVRQ